MSAGSTFDTKEQVRVATDIVDLVGNYLQLRRQADGITSQPVPGTTIVVPVYRLTRNANLEVLGL